MCSLQKKRRSALRISLEATLLILMGLLGSTMNSWSQEPKVPPFWKFTLPKGDMFEGEKVFARMECYSCHNVAGRYFKNPAERPGGIGPDLTAAHAKLPREYLAESIMNFERFIAHANYKARYRTSDGSSRMGDYSRIMTVRELIDIVEFIKSIQ